MDSLVCDKEWQSLFFSQYLSLTTYHLSLITYYSNSIFYLHLATTLSRLTWCRGEDFLWLRSGWTSRPLLISIFCLLSHSLHWGVYDEMEPMSGLEPLTSSLPWMPAEMEPTLGLEPRTPSLPWKCSSAELCRQKRGGQNSCSTIVSQRLIHLWWKLHRLKSKLLISLF